MIRHQIASMASTASKRLRSPSSPSLSSSAKASRGSPGLELDFQPLKNLHALQQFSSAGHRADAVLSGERENTLIKIQNDSSGSGVKECTAMVRAIGCNASRCEGVKRHLSPSGARSTLVQMNKVHGETAIGFIMGLNNIAAGYRPRSEFHTHLPPAYQGCPYESPQEQAHALGIIDAVLRELRCLHLAGVVHRDSHNLLNVIIRRHGAYSPPGTATSSQTGGQQCQVTLIDFGSANILCKDGNMLKNFFGEEVDIQSRNVGNVEYDDTKFSVLMIINKDYELWHSKLNRMENEVRGRTYFADAHRSMIADARNLLDEHKMEEFELFRSTSLNALCTTKTTSIRVGGQKYPNDWTFGLDKTRQLL